MKKLSRLAVAGIVVSGVLAFAQPLTATAAPKSAPPGKSGSTNSGSLPKGKPFQYLNSRIDALQSQIDGLIGQVSTLEAWQAGAEAALEKLQQDSATNAAAIALLQSELDDVKSILDTKQDIIDGTCPEGQYVYGMTPSPPTLLCRADFGAKGLALTTVLATLEIPATSSETVTAECPPGSVPSGGSYEAFDLEVSASGLSDTGYSVTAANPTGAALTLNVTATCLGVAQ